MMVLSALRPDAGILEFLAHRARSASARRLAIDVVVGVVAFYAAFRWNPSARLVIASAATVLFSYGAWGLLDRARARANLSNTRWPATAGLLEALCALCAVIGVLAGAGVLFAVWVLALGTGWIH
jgi:hypothetical protein